MSANPLLQDVPMQVIRLFKTVQTYSEQPNGMALKLLAKVQKNGLGVST